MNQILDAWRPNNPGSGGGTGVWPVIIPVPRSLGSRLLGCLVWGLCLLGHQAWGQSPSQSLPRTPNSSENSPAGSAEGMPNPGTAEEPPGPSIPPFGPRQIRMPRLDAVPQGETALPSPTPQVIAEYARYIQLGPKPGTTLELIQGRPRVLDLKVTPRRIQIADEETAQYVLLSQQEVSVLGEKVGDTVLNLWFPDQDRPGELKLLSFLVRVLPDPDIKHRLERAYKALENEINHAFPNSKIRIILLGDKVGVTGQARDIVEANQIIRVVEANVLRDPGRRTQRNPQGVTNASFDRVLPTGEPEVINMLRVPGEQQVMLQVTVAEVNRAAARSIGLNFNVFSDSGRLIAGNNTGGISLSGLNSQVGAFALFSQGLEGNNRAALLSGLGGLANIPAAVDNGQIQLAINALKNLSYARFLAEPNLTTLNGHTASFQAGGSFPVPVITGFTAAGLQGVNFIPTGVQLSFTPYITDRDRIRLVMAAEVSDRDRQALPTVIDGATIPSLVTRNFQTTVELREGQTLAVAGLIQNKLDADSARIPLFGDIPVLNRLLNFDRIAHDETELVILVTPQLVHPYEREKAPPLPGADIVEPNDLEFYLLGRIESHTGVEYRSPIRTDLSRQLQYRRMELQLLAGPHGPASTIPFPQEMVVEPAPGAPGATPNPVTMIPDMAPAPMPVPGIRTAPEVLPTPIAPTPTPRTNNPLGPTTSMNGVEAAPMAPGKPGSLVSPYLQRAAKRVAGSSSNTPR